MGSGYSELEKIPKTGSLYPRFTINRKIKFLMFIIHTWYSLLEHTYYKLLKKVGYFSLNGSKTNVIYIALNVAKTIPHFFWNLT